MLDKLVAKYDGNLASRGCMRPPWMRWVGIIVNLATCRCREPGKTSVVEEKEVGGGAVLLNT